MRYQLAAAESLLSNPGGLPPVHYTFFKDELWWSHSIFELTRLMTTKPFPQPIPSLLAGRIFKGVQGAGWNTSTLTLPPGYTLFWDGTHLRGSPTPPQSEDHDPPFRDVWEATLDRFAQADGPVALALSGGVDSIGLLWGLSHRGVEVHAYSVDDGIADDELPRATHYARQWAHKHSVVATTPSAPLTAADEGAFLQLVRCMEAPLYSFHGLAKYRLFQRIRADGFDAVLTGVGADEFMVGDPRHLLGDASPWTLRRTEDTHVLRKLGMDLELEMAPGRDVVRDALVRELLAAETLPVELGAARSNDLRLDAPFLSDRLVRWCKSATTEELINNEGQEPLGKWPYRKWLRGILPEHERLATKRPRYLEGPPARCAGRLLKKLADQVLVESLGLNVEQTKLLGKALESCPDPATLRVSLRLCSLLHLAHCLGR